MEQLQVGYKLFLPTQDGFQRLDIQCFQNLQMLLTSCSSQDSEIQVRIAGTAQSIRSQMTGYCWLVFIRTFPLFRGTTRTTFLLCPISWVQQVSWHMLFYSVLEALKSSTHIPAFAVPAFVKINDIAVWEGRQNIFWQREHFRCFEDGSDFNREVRNTNSCIRLLIETFFSWFRCHLRGRVKATLSTSVVTIITMETRWWMTCQKFRTARARAWVQAHQTCLSFFQTSACARWASMQPLDCSQNIDQLDIPYQISDTSWSMQYENPYKGHFHTCSQ